MGLWQKSDESGGIQAKLIRDKCESGGSCIKFCTVCRHLPSITLSFFSLNLSPFFKIYIFDLPFSLHKSPIYRFHFLFSRFPLPVLTLQVIFQAVFALWLIVDSPKFWTCRNNVTEQYVWLHLCWQSFWRCFMKQRAWVLYFPFAAASLVNMQWKTSARRWTRMRSNWE